jgi:tRNA 5-methylaminomethyl-2-thiouridine biosynthesis bifunctional protein
MSDLEWTDEGAPRSRRFDDVYFSREGGLAESRAVFLEGCGLPDAWAGRRRFAVGELGFGTGLNVLALLQLWARTRPSGGRLHVFSVEAFPISPDEAARALAVWPELADLAARLLARWPQAQGVRRIDWPEIGATLDVAVAEAATALRDWDGAADAWFLDGFSPAKNPEMWRDEVFALVQVRSAPGARLATFTVAGVVRRGLALTGSTSSAVPATAVNASGLRPASPACPQGRTRRPTRW